MVGTPAPALEPVPGEDDAIKQCEQRICTMVLTRKDTGEDLTCKLAKTWDRDTLKGGEEKSVTWGFGDAQCKLNLDVKRRDVISALTEKKHEVDIPPHTVKCSVERSGEMRPVTATLAPRLQFKNGKASKIWINLKELDGPADVKATVWTAAQLENTLGIFHKSMLKSVNKFLHQKCAARYHADGTPKPDPKEIARQKKAAAAKKPEPKPKAADAKPEKPTQAKPDKPNQAKPAQAAAGTPPPAKPVAGATP